MDVQMPAIPLSDTQNARSINAGQWALHDAKTQFSALVRQAVTAGPQYVSVHGKPSVVVVSVQDFQRLRAVVAKPKFTDLMRQSPFVGLDLDFSRLPDAARNMSLDD
jgi:antitoxin Phd